MEFFARFYLSLKIQSLNPDATPITILTVGSTALKVGLHPKATWFRKQVQALNDAPKVQWLEYQCRTDFINFFRTNPEKLMGVVDGKKPDIVEIRIKNMVDDKTYNRIRRNFFRVHYQFVFGNTKQYYYDFMDICFGITFAIDRDRSYPIKKLK